MPDEKKESAAIPSWQKATGANEDSPVPDAVSAALIEQSEELLDVARQFLEDDAVRNTSRDEKAEYLKAKGLSEENIEKLLSERTDPQTELKTIHDTSLKANVEVSQPSAAQIEPASTPANVQQDPKPEAAPIITYPEFLLKPSKPPPLITVSRLLNTAYILAGVSALTWGASKYLIDPMLETLTEARHELADTTLEDLSKLNDKLETMVSHVPYIASTALKKAQEQEEDILSVDSDPTELFHRDTATQTSPGLSRSSSSSSISRPTLDPTISQSERLAVLEYSLRSLLQSINHTKSNETHLQNTVKDFQDKLDKLESNYSLLKSDYYGSSSIYSSAVNDAKKGVARENEAQKFKQEIRSLKGAFLSSRNFPTASRQAPTALPGGYVAGTGAVTR